MKSLKEIMSGRNSIVVESIAVEGETVAVRIKRLTAGDVLRLGQADQADQEQAALRLVAASALDDDGKAIFASAEAVAVADAAIVLPLLQLVNKYNGLNIAPAKNVLPPTATSA